MADELTQECQQLLRILPRVVEAVDCADEHTIKAAVQPLVDFGIKPDEGVGTSPEDFDLYGKLRWYSGQILAIIEKEAWYAVNSWINVSTRMFPPGTPPGRVKFKLGKMGDGPRYDHDCSACLFCGRIEEFDIYWCAKDEAVGAGTIILRYSSEGSEYYSTLVSIALRRDPNVTTREHDIAHRVARELLTAEHVKVVIS